MGHFYWFVWKGWNSLLSGISRSGFSWFFIQAHWVLGPVSWLLQSSLMSHDAGPCLFEGTFSVLVSIYSAPSSLEFCLATLLYAVLFSVRGCLFVYSPFLLIMSLFSSLGLSFFFRISISLLSSLTHITDLFFITDCLITSWILHWSCVLYLPVWFFFLFDH